MVPDQESRGNSTTFATFDNVTTAMREVVIEYYDNPEEQHFEPFIPTSWILELKRYDRINSNRQYLSEIARANRHSKAAQLLGSMADREKPHHSQASSRRSTAGCDAVLDLSSSESS